jgi:hypothetical protein
MRLILLMLAQDWGSLVFPSIRNTVISNMIVILPKLLSLLDEPEVEALGLDHRLTTGRDKTS